MSVDLLNSAGPYTYEYMGWRGVTRETMRFYDVKTKIDAAGKPVALGYPYPGEGIFKVRSLASKDFFSVGEISKAGLFGRDKFSSGSHKYVTITEGELDALSLYQVLQSPVVSVQSAAVAKRDCLADHEWLQGFDRIYLAFDGDDAGRKAVRAVAALFDNPKVFIVKFDRLKDANEYLKVSAEEELRNLWWNSKTYRPDHIESSLTVFEKILSDRPVWGVPAYPCQALNEMTYGIRTGESVLLTAQEGVGKTEIMHAILYNLLKGTQHAVGAIFLEEPKRRLLQALAGLELGRPCHLPDNCPAEGEVYSGLAKVVGQDDRLNVYSHFGSDDPEHILDTIRFLAAGALCRYVFLDHIGMVVSGLAGDDERRALDYLSTRLEMLVKELDFALIMVSHVNDHGQTRGSRMISKIADIRIHVERDPNADTEYERNTTQLWVKKNRYSGKTGPAGIIRFDPVAYRYYDEQQLFEPSNDNLPSMENVA